MDPKAKAAREFLEGIVGMAEAAPNSPQEREAAADAVASMVSGIIGLDEDDITDEDRAAAQEVTSLIDRLAEPSTADFFVLVLKKTARSLSESMKKGGV